jgi:hypothetical protein
LRFHPAGAAADTESFRKLISRRLRVSALKSLSVLATDYGRTDAEPEAGKMP